jgi:hypothetical protein
MRIQGRLLRPSTLAERRVLKSLSLDVIRVPRRANPFAIARLIRRTSLGGPDMAKLKALVKRPVPVPTELPDSTSEPRQTEPKQDERAA